MMDSSKVGGRGAWMLKAVVLLGVAGLLPAAASVARGVHGDPVPARPSIPSAPAAARRVVLPPASQEVPQDLEPGEQVVLDDLSPADPDHFEGSAFGFAVGEERRYELGPADALRAGEAATWTLELVELGDERARFAFTHSRSETDMGVFNLGDARRFAVEIEGRVEVNRDGFPLALQFTERQRISGAANRVDGVRTIHYDFDAEERRFHKRLQLGSRDYDFPIAVARHDRLDLDVPRGLFLFLPSGLQCLGRPRQLGCEEAAFANPGLFSLAFPWLWRQRSGEVELLFFTPEGLGGEPQGLIHERRFARRERDQLANVRRYYERAKLRLEAKEPVAVGDRTIEAWRIDVGGPVRAVWALEDGTVVRIDIDIHPVTHRDRWIRQVLPGEF